MKQTEYIFGIRPIEEALEQGREIEKIVFQKNLRGEASQKLMQAARSLEIPVQQVPLAAMNKITRKNHQGVIAYLSPITYQDLDEIVIRCFEDGKDPLVLVLDHITDVRNMGAIARTAECAGVDVLVVPARGGARISGDAIKTSAGALMSIPVHRSEDLVETVKKLKNYGMQIVASTEKTETDYTEGSYQGPLAIVTGSEEYGISSAILKIADFNARIPLLGSIDSLNVSVATGIILFEALRQKRMAKEKS
jgi:23S rRNA (guanosine2251-2'-O)-methyltransferase